METAKNRPLSKNAWYEWCDWLISHIPKSVKKSLSNIKEKIMNLFLKDYKPKKLEVSWIISISNTKGKEAKKYQSNNTLKQLEHT